MKIIIIGAGAMGSLFGSKLSLVSDVYLLDPFKNHVDLINNKGLSVEKPDGSSENYKLFATTDPKVIPYEIDLAIIFTKSNQTKEAALIAKPLLSKHGVALTLQNGIGNYDIISDILGKEKTIVGVTSHGGTMLGAGHIRHAGTGPTYIAASLEDQKRIDAIVETFNKADIDTVISDNLDSLIWGKLVINVGINALTAILRVKNGIIGKTTAVVKIMEKAVNEAVLVAKALNIELPYENPVEQVKKVCEATAANRASMLQDTLRGVHTEINVINRAIEKRGKALGIATPYNTFLSEVVEALESTIEHRISPN